MRILWSSEAAQEMLNRLEQAQTGMEDCTLRSASARRALEAANVEGDDAALTKAMQRFDECARKLSALSESLEDFVRAVRRTDEMFCEAEESVGRLAQRAEPQSAGTIEDYARYANWNADACAVMPGMRLEANSVPGWLSDVLDEAELVSSME